MKRVMTMPDLPRPNVEVTSRETDSGHEVDVVISRDDKGRAYTGGGDGKSRDAAIGEVIGKILGDHNSTEWIPKG